MRFHFSYVLIAIMLLMTTILSAQTTTELEALKKEKSAELTKLQTEFDELKGKVNTLKKEVAGITEKLTPYPRWKKGISGTSGFSFSSFNTWLLRSEPNTTAINIGLGTALFANGEWEKTFWRNSTNVTLGWLKFDNQDVSNTEENPDFQASADAFNIVSVYGYKLSDKFAVSTLGEYRTSILQGRFNDAGYLDIGVGTTWTPVKDLIMVVNPVNGNLIFTEDDTDFQSSLGSKIVADYTKKIIKGFNWKSNLSAFLSYEGTELSNWTWTNNFSTAVKGIGVGLDVGLRANQQEVDAFNAKEGVESLEGNPLQSYWILGLSYAISSK